MLWHFNEFQLWFPYANTVYTYLYYIEESVCVTDVTSLPQRVLWERGYNVYHNAYDGNESPNCCHGRVDDQL